ncbi:MAG: hypothetical protein GY832_36595, partial [Chloroflexi bacterium]|nr:hypothetical protein [Chloroflexota bacterium]
MNETEPETDASAGLGGSGAKATLPGDGSGEATDAGMDRVASSDNALTDSPIFQSHRFGPQRVVQVDIGDEQGDAICDEYGQPLVDGDGNYFFARAGYRAVRDQTGRVRWTEDGHLQLELIEDALALMTREVIVRTPESLSDQVERLQTQLVQSQQNLERSQFAHRKDVERAQVVVDQAAAQSDADRRAMEAEMATRMTAYQNAIHAHKQGRQATIDEWTALVEQLQSDHVIARKETTDVLAQRIAELEQQNAAHVKRHGELQQKTHVSEPVVQSKTLNASNGVATVLTRAPMPNNVATVPAHAQMHVIRAGPPRMPSVAVPVVQHSLPRQYESQQVRRPTPFGAVTVHPQIPPSALPQVQVVDVAQQRDIERRMLTHKEAELTRVKCSVADSVNDPVELARFLQMMAVLERECDQLRADFQRKFGQSAATTTMVGSSAAPAISLASQATNLQSGATTSSLGVVAAGIQPVNGVLPDSALSANPASASTATGNGQITLQEYETYLDPSYVADRQWERDERQKEYEEKEKECAAQRQEVVAQRQETEVQRQKAEELAQKL